MSSSEKVEHMNMSPAQNVPEQYSFITTEETNFIGILNHYCQKTKRFLDFKLVEKSGPSHNPQWVYRHYEKIISQLSLNVTEKNMTYFVPTQICL